MLAAFDPQTIWERLQLEVAENKKLKDDPWTSPITSYGNTTPGLRRRFATHAPISQINETYQLVADQTRELPVQSLPRVTLVDGAVLLDGEVQSVSR